MSDISLDAAWYDNQLLCPVCKSNNLHHCEVEVFHRREDAEQVRVTHVEGGDVTHYEIANDVSGNPSSRRSGLRVKFYCEHCHGDPKHADGPLFSLNILQHKGTTFLSWDY